MRRGGRPSCGALPHGEPKLNLALGWRGVNEQRVGGDRLAEPPGEPFSEPPRDGDGVGVGAARERPVDLRMMQGVERAGPLHEPPRGAEEAVHEGSGAGTPSGANEPVTELAVVIPRQVRRLDAIANEPDRPLQHRRRRPHRMVPVDLAEHDVAGEDHELGRRAALLRDGQRPARFVEAEARQQPLLIEMPAVGHARVEAVAGEIVHLVDVDRPREERTEQAAGGVGSGAGDEARDAGRGDPPFLLDARGKLPSGEQRMHERFVPRQLREAHVFERMAKGPVADVVHERSDDECRGVVLVDRGREPRLVAEPGEKLQREPVDAERMLEP